ncbi:Altered inheritance of mitochondria protein 24, mitochondrial [Savitreella phatthalungensis]
MTRPQFWASASRRCYATVHPGTSTHSTAVIGGVSSPSFKVDLPSLSGHGPFPERPVFSVTGSPFSLLNASVPRNAPLYTRRGSLVGINGSANAITSHLSVFSTGLTSTATRALTNTPFLYQKLTSSEPFTALIGTRSTATSFAVLELDGRVDWNVTSKRALLCWSGLQPRTAQDGIDGGLLGTSTVLTGRGSAVVCGDGQVYELVLNGGESYVLHPSNVVAYMASCPKPESIKLRLPLGVQLRKPRLQIRDFLRRYEFFRVMGQTDTWGYIVSGWNAVKRLGRKLVWGDQLYVRFTGPTTILLQSRSTDVKFIDEADHHITSLPHPLPLDADDAARSQKHSHAGSLKIAEVRNGVVHMRDAENFEQGR